MDIHSLMFLIVLLPLLGSVFVLSSKDNTHETFKNTEEVALLTVFVNILLVLGLFSKTDINTEDIQHIVDYSWSFLPIFKFSFGVDLLSLIFILSTQLAVFVGVLGIRKYKQTPKSVLFYALVYLSFLNGCFLSLDILSFYICFAGNLFPLYMLVALTMSERQHKMLLRLALHHFTGALLLLAACILILAKNGSNILISDLDKLHFALKSAVLVWGGLFAAFVLRLPVWPFHHSMTSVAASLKNPLAFITLHIMPITGIYGFMRCWPLNIPFEISVLSPMFQILCLLTMIFAAVGSYIHSNTSQKLYNYVFVYDLLYLLAVFLPTSAIRINIAYCVFSFLLISSCLIVLQAHMLEQSQRANASIKGILCLMPRASIAYFLFVIAAIGLPVSAFFWNNFMIVSEIFNFNLYSGTLVVIIMTLAGISLLQSLYTLKEETCVFNSDVKIKDIDVFTFVICLMLMIVLLLSLIKPLWFVF